MGVNFGRHSRIHKERRYGEATGSTIHAGVQDSRGKHGKQWRTWGCRNGRRLSIPPKTMHGSRGPGFCKNKARSAMLTRGTSVCVKKNPGYVRVSFTDCLCSEIPKETTRQICVALWSNLTAYADCNMLIIRSAEFEELYVLYMRLF